MAADKRSVYQLYDIFRNDIRKTRNTSEVLSVLSPLLPALKAETFALLEQADAGRRHSLEIAGHIGWSTLWTDYLNLCRSNTEPLLRTLRLSPHPVALSDIQCHPRLRRRASRMMILLAAQGLTDAFAIPSFDHRRRFSAVMIMGQDLSLRPTSRYLMTQMATDVFARLASINATPPTFSAPPALTPRQLEIATWLIAGKTDWEIGKILQISPKTVNFHVENIKRAYNVKSRNQFVAAFVRGERPATRPAPNQSPGPPP